jgi:C4-dicarboxylate-specific signal transduction histidine kinase
MSEEHLVQVLLNLLMNAADAMSGTGGITIEATSAEGRVRLSVTDTGPGIAPEVEGRLFEPFVTTKPTGKGTGLGLAVCHSLIERAGGTIRTERPEAGGACFVLSLPAA